MKSRSSNLRIDPDFVVPEPTGARHFCTMPEAEWSDMGKRQQFLDRWKANGVQQIRVTIINDEHPHEPYPSGVWIEGWDDEKARQLPFGYAEEEGGPIYPPLLCGGKLWSGSPPPSGE